MCLLCNAAMVASAAAAKAPAAAPLAATGGASGPPFLVANFVSPVLLSAFGWNLYSYGTLVAAALGIALMVFAADLRRAAIDLDEISCFFVFLVGFAVGSKAHLALSMVGAGEELTWQAFDIRSGHSFMGSQIGAVLAMLVYIRIHRVGVLRFLDVLLPCCLLGHTIGKCGCFLSGDGCYGPPADPRRVPWAMSFPNAAVPTLVPVHPTPLYEAACSFGVFLAARLWLPLPQPSEADGRRTALVLVLYGIERVIVEQFRRHPPIELFGGLTEYQVLALVLLAIGAAMEGRARLQRRAAPRAGSGETTDIKRVKKQVGSLLMKGLAAMTSIR